MGKPMAPSVFQWPTNLCGGSIKKAHNKALWFFNIAPENHSAFSRDYSGSITIGCNCPRAFSNSVHHNIGVWRIGPIYSV